MVLVQEQAGNRPRAHSVRLGKAHGSCEKEKSMEDADFALALSLQQQEFDLDENVGNRNSSLLHSNEPHSIVDQDWELLDPTPDVLALFQEFNKTYFFGKLDMVEVKWSKRMTLCAGLCRYEGVGGLCSIALSQPLLKLRPRKDLVQTLLHEMIHAFLFVTQNNKDHDAHGPEFCKHMTRINQATGANITIYHSFHDEVNEMRRHWWRCQGLCRFRPPYFGYVKRAMNREPSSRDLWWDEHQRTCGGNFVKIREPENFKKKEKKKTVLDPFGSIKQKKSKSKPSHGITSKMRHNATGTKLGGSTQVTGNDRGVPGTSRLLTSIQQPETGNDRGVPGTSRLLTSIQQPKTGNDRGVPGTSRLLTSIQEPKISSRKESSANVHDKWTRLAGVKKRSIVEAVPVRRKKKKNNLHDFFIQLKKRGGRSVNEGAPAFETIPTVVNFSRKIVHFDDSDDENSDKENGFLAKTKSAEDSKPSIGTDRHIINNNDDGWLLDRIMNDMTDLRGTNPNDTTRVAPSVSTKIHPIANIETKTEEDSKPSIGTDRHIINNDDDGWLLDRIMNDMNDLRNTNPNNTTRVSPSVLTKIHPIANIKTKTEEKRTSRRARKRLPSFSDEDETLTQVWNSHVDSKKMKFNPLPNDDAQDPELPVFLNNKLFTTSPTKKSQVLEDFTPEMSNHKEQSMSSQSNSLTKSLCDNTVSSLNSASEDSVDFSHVSCPICGMVCPTDNINKHIDKCLSAEESPSTSKTTRDANRKTTAEKSRDEVYGDTGAQSLSNHCVGDDKAKSESIDSNIAGSVLSQPLVPNNEPDISPRLNSPAESAVDTYALCPICGIMCLTEMMNNHIDDCLSLHAINESKWD